MPKDETIFEKTYKDYLGQIKDIHFESVAPILGAEVEKDSVTIRVFNNRYRVSPEGITGPSGRRPSYDICVMLSKYLLLCPAAAPNGGDWVTFKGLKDSGPLIAYFAKNIEGAIGSSFSGRLEELQHASRALGGYAPVVDVNYDFCVQFDALPKVPVILLFNDVDKEFPATCTLLFESRAEKYLDAECLAMLGSQLFVQLRKTG